MIKLSYTILYGQNVTNAVVFYEKAFGFQRKFVTPDDNYGELIAGDTTLSFASTELANTNLKDGFVESSSAQKPFGIEIGFTTDYVEATVKSAVDAGAIVLAEPKTKPWGQTVVYVRDLDGFLVEIPIARTYLRGTDEALCTTFNAYTTRIHETVCTVFFPYSSIGANSFFKAFFTRQKFLCKPGN